MWFWRKRATALPAAQQVRSASRAVIEGLERRCLMSITAVSVDTGDYVAPQQNGSAPPTGGSMVENVSGFNGTFSFELQASDGELGDQGGGFSFDPNSTFSGTVGEFADQGVPDVNDYTGTIDWGDGTTTAATFAMDGGAVAVRGTAADVGGTVKLIVADASGVRGVVTLVFVP